MELFTKLEIITMVSVVGFLVFIILLLSLLELLSRRKEKKTLGSLVEEKIETEEIKHTTELVEEAEEENFGELLIQKTEAKDTEDNYMMNFTSSINIEEIKEELFPEEKVLEQLEELPHEETLKVEEPEILIEDLDTPVVPIENKEAVEMLEIEPQEKAQLELLKVEEELKHPMTLEDTISSLEAIEEESAIISYQELLDVTREMQVLPEDVGDEPISITEVYERFTGEPIEHPSVDDIYQASLVNNETENLNEIQLENTANLEKLDKEIRKTNKVLNMLNELKKNLD